MIDINDAIIGSKTYTTDGMSFFERRKVKKLIKIFDKEIQKAVNIGKNSTTFHVKGKRIYITHGCISDVVDNANKFKEIYLLKNVIHLYETNGYEVEAIGNFTWFWYRLDAIITISWKDAEIEDLIEKYT